MNSCHIGNEIATAIGKGLQNNEKLEILSLKHNNISDEGMNEILEALNSNK